jgi:Kef-type K+ transport system membrane component KefB
MHSIFSELSLIIALAAGVSLIMRSIRQPLIIGYIITGILAGPAALHLIRSPETIETFSSIGIALLLFIVGLGLNPNVIKEVGKVSLLTGVGQVLFTSLIGFGLVSLFGYDTITALYIAVALAFSSTIIILKLLSDKHEQNKLFGKISIGFLLVQDVIAAFALLFASAASQQGFSYGEVGALAVKGVVVVSLVVLAVKFVIKPMTKFLSGSQEMLFLFAIAWGFGIASLFYEIGFSLEIGALLAGVALSTMTYTQEVSSRLRPLRDFFVVVFFITLGTQLDFGNIGEIVPQAAALSAFVLLGNPIIVMIIMGILGYTKKTSFKAGLVVAQISEFSLVLMLLGLQSGQVSQQAVSMVTVVGIITIAVSSYMIIYSDALYGILEKYLRLFERRKVRAEIENSSHYEAVLFGYRKGGHEFLKVFKSLKKKFIIVDYDPEVIDILIHTKNDYLYGDATDIELLKEAGMEKSKLVVSTISDLPTNVFLAGWLDKNNPHAVFICHAETIGEAERLYALGASYVMMPHYIGSEKISSFIKNSGLRKSEFKKYREKHLAYLQAHFTDSQY